MAEEDEERKKNNKPFGRENDEDNLLSSIMRQLSSSDFN